jgi:integrase
LIDVYLEARKPDMRPRSWDEIERQLRRRDWKPYHGRPANSITRADVIDRQNEIARDSGRVAADRARTALSGLYAWAINSGGYHNLTNPCVGVQAVSESKRSRTLSPDELREVWLASDPAVAKDYGRIVRLLILTGQRKSEIGSLAWGEIVTNGTGTQAEIPADRMKNGRPHVVPLASEALECLPPTPNEKRTFVFGRDRSGFKDWSSSKKELDARILANRRKVNSKAEPMDAWVLHDLRRSFSTRMREERIADPHLIELILCHVSGLRAGVAGTYDKSERLEDRRSALEAWGRYIRKLVEPRQEPMAA